jgi:hypothetical protein
MLPLSARVRSLGFALACLFTGTAPAASFEGPVISEFVASNVTGLTDQFGLREDWIEIHNPTDAPVNLSGWFLTDTSTNLKKWKFPAVTLPAAGHLVVFASDRNLRNAANPLHTNFKLSAGGEYLALVEPDGLTIACEFAPLFPEQVADISYGLTAVPGTWTPQIVPGMSLEAMVPAAAPSASWKLPTFVPDASWSTGPSGVGYDVTSGVTGPARILFVVNTAANAAGKSGDQSVETRLIQVFGHEVTKIDDGAVQAASTDGMDLVIVSSTVDSSTVNTKLRDVVVPVINWDRALTDDFLLSSTGSSLTSQTSLEVTATGAVHPLGAGLAAGSTTVRNAAGSMNTASNTNLAPDAVVIARSTGGLPAVVLVEEGGELRNGGSAPAARIHMFLGDDGVAPLNAQGLALFDACVSHVLGDIGPPSPYTHLIGHNLRVPMRGHASSAFLRFSFNPESVSSFRRLLLNIRADDGYVAWLNGVEIARRNAPATPLWNSAATAAGDGLTVESIDVSDHVGLLVAGTRNTLAIQGLNVTPGDADFLVLPELVAGTGTLAEEEYYSVATPGAPNVESSIGFVPSVTFSAERGYFSTPFSLTLSNSLPGVQIRYTTDGTAPTATTGEVYTGPIPISTTATIRACAYLSGYNSLRPETRTYLHLPAILQQPASIAGWPQPAISVGIGAGSRVHDYEMDPEIAGNPAYQADLAAGMTSIPTISVVVKKSDMWDSSGNGGFYRSADIERAGSVEYIDPADPTENRQAECGVEGHSHDRMKRSLRLSFKAAYGESKFDSSIFTGSPWGGGMGNRQVDNIVLRAGNNHSFARVWNPTRTTYTEDEWYRATQIAMGGTGSPGRFVHLFINGIYWGLYNAVQRPDADFAAGSMGGSKEDWFSASHDGPNSGDTTRWNYLTTTLLAKNMSQAANYAELGEYVDLPALVDYVLCAFYSGLDDWPENNWWGASRNSPAGPFQFFGWDGETAWGTGNGSNLTAWVHPAFRTSGGDTVSPAPKIWHAARANPDFLMLIADRTFKHLSNGGALSTAEAVGRWDRIAEHVRTAVVAECARWGDVMQEPPSRPDIEWRNEVNRVRNIMLSGNVAGTGTNDNGKVLLSTMRSRGFHPAIDPPGFSQEGGAAPAGFQLSMTNPNAGGTIYYTMDGSDPRQSGGAIAGSAYNAPVSIPYTLTVKARVRQSGVWSAMHERTFISEGAAPLRITEIMFNPAQPNVLEAAEGFIDNEEFEFLEIRNIGTQGIDLNGAHFTSGLTFIFGPRSLPAGGSVVLVRNADAFAMRYGAGVPIEGEYQGSLDNSGERLHLKNAEGNTLFDVTYSGSWHLAGMEGGHSLVPVDLNAPLADWATEAGWRPSMNATGSPGATEPAAPTPPDFDDWRLARFSATELGDANASGANADFDKDGLANVLEYVFGTDPKVPGAGRAAVVDAVVTRGSPSLVKLPGGGWRLVFARRKVAELGGLVVMPQTGTTLSGWTSMTGSPVLLGDDGEIEILGLDVPAGGEAGFFRISVAEVP